MVWGSLSDTSMVEDSGLQIQLQLNTSEEYELSISSDTLKGSSLNFKPSILILSNEIVEFLY